MNGRGIASFLAGMGTGYFNTEEKKKEQARKDAQEKRDNERFELDKKRLQLELDRETKANARDDALSAGMQEAAKMKVGQLQDQNGALDTSADSFKSRLEANGIDPTIAAETAPIYEKAAKEKGSESWLSNSFGSPAAGGIGQIKQTSKADIARKQAEALSAGGKFDQSIAMQEKANALDIEDLQGKILASKTWDEFAKNYDHVDDGWDIKTETDQKTGRTKYWYQNLEGKIIYPQDGPKDFADLNEAKAMGAAYITKNADKIIAYNDRVIARKREDSKDTRDSEKHNIDMKAGELGLDAAASDLKVKKATEGARIEGVKLDNASKIANIQQSKASTANAYDQIRERKETAKATSKAEKEANEEKRKNGDQFRQDVNAAVSMFDKSYRRDSTGNIMGSELDPQLYSQAVNVIGNEIKKGASIDDAQAIGRTVYDKAKVGGVSVKTAYQALQNNIEKEASKAAPKAVSGADAAKGFFK